MTFQNLNPWAILVAAASAFLLGGLWYSQFLFGALRKPPAGKTFAIGFVLSLVMAANLAMFLNDPKTNLAWGATAGFLAGFGWCAIGLAIVGLFEPRPWKYAMINGGYLTVALVLMGAILGAWR